MKNGRLNFKQPARARPAWMQSVQAQSSGLQPPDLPAADEPPAGSVLAD